MEVRASIGARSEEDESFLRERKGRSEFTEARAEGRADLRSSEMNGTTVTDMNRDGPAVQDSFEDFGRRRGKAPTRIQQ
jgi:hypothetical protein